MQLQNGPAFFGDLFLDELPQLVGTFLNAGMGQDEAPVRGEVEIGGDGIPVGVIDLSPVILGLLLFVADSDSAICLMGQFDGVDMLGPAESVLQYFLPEGDEEGGKVDHRQNR